MNVEPPFQGTPSVGGFTPGSRFLRALGAPTPGIGIDALLGQQLLTVGGAVVALRGVASEKGGVGTSRQHAVGCALDLSEAEEFMQNQVRASHILLMYLGSSRSTATRSKQEAQEQIARIKGELDAGGDFASLARQHSDCPSSSRGGDLGAFGRGQMVKPFEETAFGLQVGAISDIVETDFGYHLIQRTG